MIKTCTVSGKQFEITEDDLKFYEKMGVPTPTLCPAERERRRMIWSNQQNLYRRTCSGTGKSIISNFSEDHIFPVYEVNYFFTDKWDKFAIGRDFDFNNSFFPQFKDLSKIAPRPSLQRSPEYDENSEYTNYAGKNKNCYLIFDSDKNRDSLYSYSINTCEDVVDCYRMDVCELCFQSMDCSKCYNGEFFQNCVNCNDSKFLKNCIGCKNCFGCVNLRNKEYYFLNEKYTQKEYEDKVAKLELDKFLNLKNLRNHFTQFVLKFPHKFMEGVNNENVLGNYLTNCKNAQYCFDSRKLWDCKYVTQAFDDAKNCMDCIEVGDEVELQYECYCLGYGAYNNRFCTHQLGSSSHLDYCYFTPFCKDCFGCIGLHHAQYCILNKQYTKEEYEILVPKIIEHMKKTGEWGEFFPIELSPFAYNETVAQEYFPLTKEEALKRGYKWKEIPDQVRNDNGGDDNLVRNDSVDWENVPDSITEVSDDIVKEILSCQTCSKQYKIQKAELKFYRKMNLPIPRKCPDCRHADRMKLRNPRKLWKRNCDKCLKEIQTTFAPERPEKVYCEACYLKEVN